MRWLLGSAIALTLTFTNNAIARAEPEAARPETDSPTPRAEESGSISLLAAEPAVLGRLAGASLAIAPEDELPRYAPTVRLSIEMVIDGAIAR